MNPNKYLEKVAEERKKDNAFVQAGKGFGALVGGSLAMTPVAIAQMHVGKKVLNYVDSPHEHANLGTIKKMLRDNKMDVSMNHRPHHVDKHLNGGLAQSHRPLVSGVRGPVFIPGKHMGPGNKNFLGGVKKPDYNNVKFHNPHGSAWGGRMIVPNKIVNKDVIMHELGHAKDFSRHGKIKTGLTIGGGLANKIAPALLLNDKTKDYAVPVAAAASAITLRNEAMANYHAYKGIKAHKGVAAARGFARKLLPSQMGAYALGAATSVGTVYAGKKILDHLNKKND